MMGFFHSAWVIGRRDFVATVWSRTFLFFLLGPLIIIGFSILFGMASGRMARQDTRSSVAVVAGAAEFDAIQAAWNRVNAAFGHDGLTELVRVEPAKDSARQVKTLLGASDKRVIGVLTGGLSSPILTGPLSETLSVRRQMTLVLDEALRDRALAAAHARPPPVDIRIVAVDQSSGALATERAMTARGGQLLVFMLTVLLAGMLLSNLLEEKSNKIIEVLASAVPIDAIFVGKLFSMLAVSLVGLAVWAGGAVVALVLSGSAGGAALPEPAVGSGLFVPLVLIYYASNYLLLGALFLGVGSQANSVREVQTLSMPITVGQMLLFLLASMSVGPFNSPVALVAAIFPFSSPMVMVSRAAQTGEIWAHFAALAWQGLWVWLTVRLGAYLFRRNVLKSGSGARPGLIRRLAQRR